MPSASTTTTVSNSYVHGYVVDELGSGLSGVQISVYTSSGALITNTSTRSDGFFYAILEYGTYSIYFSKPGYAKVTRTITLQKADTNLGTIELGWAIKLSSPTLGLIVAPGGKVSIPFTLSNSGENVEIVHFLVSKPQGWSARILDQSREVMMAYVPSGQSLQFQLEVSVPMASLANLEYEVSVEAIGTINATLTFTIKVGEKLTVYGRVIDESGNRLEGAQIDAYASDGTSLGSWDSSSDGSFALELPASLTISLSFSKPGYAKVTKTLTLYGNTDLGNVSISKAVRLSSSMLGLVANPGEKLLIPFLLSNTGTESEAIDFSTVLPEGWFARVLSQSGQEVSRIVVSPGASSNFQLEVTIPLAKVGDYEVTLTASGNAVCSQTFAIKVQPPSEAAISCQFPGKTVKPGEAVRFQVRVKNPLDLEQRFRISLDFQKPGWTTSVKSSSGESISEVTLRGNEFVDLIVDISTSPSAEDGRYEIPIRAESSSGFSEEFSLLLVVQRPERAIELTASPPYVDVYAGSQAKFKMKLSNLGGYDELLDLTLKGISQELRAWFEDTNKQEIKKVYVEAGQSKEFYVVVSIPKGASLGTKGFFASVTNSNLNKTVGLTLNILGLYEVRATNANFYTSLNVGGEGTFTLSVKNTGSQAVTNVKAIAGTTPDGFSVTVDPTSLTSLAVDEEASFTIKIKTESDVNAGNYYIDFSILSDQTEPKTFTLRVEVLQETSWLVLGGIIMVVAIVGLFFVYRRFGRR
jgi:uncharacterized repeat protein (TIGR01451 family)